MSKRKQAVLIIVAWCAVGAISLTVRNGVLNLADFFPGAAALAAMGDGQITGAEWFDVLLAYAVLAIFLWRMIRRTGQPENGDDS